ncbi:hypothetical protein MVAC_21368 [Mycolicibacterium vaccae ATCC 25954]|uniref:Uncharacterized protein n=1 Tax=Mycolicibacterium vaccae ATCC 25954 TaxID=1194972 RepID=K0V6K6_MYCVA|nr:hypothetical protein MVAC_21368 [Mycolicibacterium vaccae ATCC 25954]
MAGSLLIVALIFCFGFMLGQNSGGGHDDDDGYWHRGDAPFSRGGPWGPGMQGGPGYGPGGPGMYGPGMQGGQGYGPGMPGMQGGGGMPGMHGGMMPGMGGGMMPGMQPPSSTPTTPSTTTAPPARP